MEGGGGACGSPGPRATVEARPGTAFEVVETQLALQERSSFVTMVSRKRRMRARPPASSALTRARTAL